MKVELSFYEFKKHGDSFGCHSERELASYLAEERRPLACPLARLLPAHVARLRAYAARCGGLAGPVTSSNIKSSSRPASPSEWQDETSASMLC
jgi:hypothetical protein